MTPPVAASGATPPAAAAAAAGGSVRIVIAVPQAPAFRTGRRPSYVSPATRSVSFDVWNAKHTAQVKSLSHDVKPGTNTITFSLPAAAYSLDAMAFDRPGGTGNLLASILRVPFTVIAGKTVPVPFTMDGLPMNVQIVPEAGDLYVGGNQSGGFQLAGLAPQAFDVFARDADGNVIFGPGSAKIALTSSSANLLVTAAGQANPNRFFVRRSGTPSKPMQLVASATPAVGSGGVRFSATVPVTNVPLTYLYQSAAIGEYAPWSSQPVATLSGPSSATTYSKQYQQNQLLAVDKTGTLYALDSASDVIYVYPAGKTAASRWIEVGVHSASAIAVDSHDNLYVANVGSNAIARYAPGGSKPNLTITTGINDPTQIIFDGSDTLYVASSGNSSVPVYTYGTYVPDHVITDNVYLPYGIALDGSGKLYVGNPNSNGNNEVFVYAPGATTSSSSLVVGASTLYTSAFLGGLAVDAAGNICVAETGQVACGNKSQGGLVSIIADFPKIENEDFAPAMMFDPSGDLYVTSLQPATDQLRVYPPFGSVFAEFPSPMAVISGSTAVFSLAIQE